MAVTLGPEALAGVIGMEEAIDLLEATYAHEAAGKTSVSPRLSSAFAGGWIRILFAADSQSGYCATKAYNLAEGVGVRYVVTLYRVCDGELLAIMDGRTITDLRTGAASGVAARKVPVSGPVSVGIVGSGHQARTQLESLASVYQDRIGRRLQPDGGEPRGLRPRDVGETRLSRDRRRSRSRRRSAAGRWSPRRAATRVPNRSSAASGWRAAGSSARSGTRGRSLPRSTNAVSASRGSS